MGWLANILLVAGLWKVGNKDRLAFPLTIAGEIIWVAIAGRRGQWDLAFICAVFAIMAIRNWRAWSKS